jgi:hypothetical protein
MQFIHQQPNVTQIVTSGGLANESLFAIILYSYNELDNVIAHPSHMTDWSRLKNPTSPHMFKDADEKDIQFIEKTLAENEYVMFIRKIHPEFPDEVLKKYIYEYSKEKDDQLVIHDTIFYKTPTFLNIFSIIVFFIHTLPFLIAVWYLFSYIY